MLETYQIILIAAGCLILLFLILHRSGFLSTRFEQPELQWLGPDVQNSCLDTPGVSLWFSVL